MDVSIIIIIALLVILILLVFFKDKIIKPEKNDTLSKDLETKLYEMFPKILQNANTQLVAMADQKLDAQKKEINSELSNKRESIEKLVLQIKEEMTKQGDKLDSAEKERITSFSALKQEIENNRKITEKLSATTEGLRTVLSNNQLRGQFGEQIAEDLLRMSGFVRGTDYEFNKKQEGSTNRPDFSVFLPDGTRINVDAKFPYNNLKRYVETENADEKNRLLKEFELDVKKKIDQVTTRDYINPDDNTVDFVILFIPNEMIFSFIYDKLNDLWVKALEKKVVMAGPFSFTAILRMVKQAHNNFNLQRNAHKVITQIKNFEIEFNKYNTEFNKIGEKIEGLTKQYDSVRNTRTNQLTKIMDKIESETVSMDKPEEINTIPLKL